nr:unnamed protein product [Callosobruchus analis]
MVLIFGETRSVYLRGSLSYNARVAARLSSERYPNRRRTTHEIILRTVNSYREGRNPGRKGSGGRPRSTQEDEVVLEEVAKDPSTSLRLIERRTGVSKSQAQRILKRYEYHPYHIQRVQMLLSSNYAKRVSFRTILKKHQEDTNIFDSTLWSDESARKRDGYLNLHNIHSRQLENSHEVRENRSQHQFKENL